MQLQFSPSILKGWMFLDKVTLCRASHSLQQLSQVPPQALSSHQSQALSSPGSLLHLLASSIFFTQEGCSAFPEGNSSEISGLFQSSFRPTTPAGVTPKKTRHRNVPGGRGRAQAGDPWCKLCFGPVIGSCYYPGCQCTITANYSLLLEELVVKLKK